MMTVHLNMHSHERASSSQLKMVFICTCASTEGVSALLHDKT